MKNMTCSCTCLEVHIVFIIPHSTIFIFLFHLLMSIFEWLRLDVNVSGHNRQEGYMAIEAAKG